MRRPRRMQTNWGTAMTPTLEETLAASIDLAHARKLHVMPAPAAPATEVPTRLSPSSVNLWADCQYKFYCRKILKLPETRSAALALGTCVHAALIENYRQKIETKKDLFPAGARAIFTLALAEEVKSGEVALQPGEDWDDLNLLGKSLVTMYMERAAPAVQPAAVEEHVEGVIGGVPVHGYIDVRDVNGRVIDIKTAARKPSGVTPAHRLQVSTYAMLHPQASGAAQITTLAKTKTVAMYQDSLDVLPRDRKLTESLYSIARDQMDAGIFAPNRSSFLCSRRHCSFWSRCEGEWGGEVGQ
jgi:RecB family exonuclease